MEKEILNRLIEIDTVKDKDNKKMIFYLKELLRTVNFEFREIGNDKKILVASRGKSNLCFICHTDTVDSSSMWTKKPLELSEDDVYYYGLGVCDMKGGIAALLSALLKIDTNIPCMICFTYDEEINFMGIKELVNQDIGLPKSLVFTEPTDLELVAANKGCLEFKVEIEGKSAHSSTPDEGINAIDIMIDFISELKAIGESLTKEKNDLYDVSYTTFNLSKIVGGDEINKVADKCYITFDFRTIKKEHNKMIKEKVLSLVNKYNGKMEVITDLNCALNCDSEEISKLEVLLNKKATGVNYVTEASFVNDKNIYIIGPGPITAHQKDEKISKSSYKDIISIYEKIITYYQ